MPVTARLSREFYDKFGDKIVDELVNWFNQVDATYRSDLKDLNELNFARFDSKLDQGIGELRAEQGRLDAKLDQRVGDFRAALETFQERVARLLAEQRAGLMKWMFIFWAGAVLTIVGSMVALFRLFVP